MPESPKPRPGHPLIHRPWRIVRARPRLFISIVCGVILGVCLPSSLRLATRILIGWDVSIALYLAFALVTFFTTDIETLRKRAGEMDDGRFFILIVTAIAALASLGGIVVELGEKPHGTFALPFTIATLVLSWFAIHATFALHYAHEYYRDTNNDEDGERDTQGGLIFPNDDAPDYWDFAYFSFVVGMTAQVSDVQISNKIIRRTAMAHGIVSFIFNTALLALMVNVAASAI